MRRSFLENFNRATTGFIGLFALVVAVVIGSVPIALGSGAIVVAALFVPERW